MSAIKISSECASYASSHKGTKWLKEHSRHGVEIIGDDGDQGLMKVYKVQSLIDGSIGTAWAREIDGLNA